MKTNCIQAFEVFKMSINEQSISNLWRIINAHELVISINTP